tara:strand:- start:10644 stop:12056 length:1413 start_codon:yes stop_codon:yes gene_type:complete
MRAEPQKLEDYKMPVNSFASQYEEIENQWQKCRDAYSGQDALIANGADYVPSLDGQSSAEYTSYIRRGLYFNATAKTVHGMMGSCFRRSPTIVAGSSEPLMGDVTLTDLSFEGLAKEAMREILITGRYGLLCDYSDEEGRPYLIPYIAENIINWTVSRISGRSVITTVCLAEIGHVNDPDDPYVTKPQQRIRVLSLEEGVYVVRVYVKINEGANKEDYILVEEIVPTIAGSSLDYIPFVCINTNLIGMEVEKPPLLDLVDVNIHHWRLSCDYNHGLHYTGLPTAIAAGFPKSNDGYKIGSGTAWWSEDSDAKASFLEFKGEGLGAMQKALEEDEHKMASLGGRLLEKQKSQAEAASAIRLRTAGDQATLAGITETLDRGLSQAIGLLNVWLGNPTSEGEIILNNDFFSDQMGAEEAEKLMHIVQAGYMTVDNLMFLYDRGELLRPNTDPTEEKEILELQNSIDSVLRAEG